MPTPEEHAAYLRSIALPPPPTLAANTVQFQQHRPLELPWLERALADTQLQQRGQIIQSVLALLPALLSAPVFGLWLFLKHPPSQVATAGVLATILFAAGIRAGWAAISLDRRRARARRAVETSGQLVRLTDDNFAGAVAARLQELHPWVRPFVAARRQTLGIDLAAWLFDPLVYRRRHPEQLSWLDCLLPALLLRRGGANPGPDDKLAQARSRNESVISYALMGASFLIDKLYPTATLWLMPVLAVLILWQLIFGPAQLQMLAARQALLEALLARETLKRDVDIEPTAIQPT